MLTIDGTMGEGGGQVLRSSLALSAVTQTPFHIKGIRARRKRPGLMRQHLTAVNAAARVCNARVSGAELGSLQLTFRPGLTGHGDFHFAVGTAGSATLVLQTVLPPLLIAQGSSRIVFEGGTHNPLAPPFDFIAQTFLPLLHRMGAAAAARLERHGFYPGGGGRLQVDIKGGALLKPLELTERGDIETVHVRALVSQIPDHVAAREIKTLSGQLASAPQLSNPPVKIKTETARVDSSGPGNAVIVTLQARNVTETFTGFGEKGVRAETVAHRLAKEVRSFLSNDVPVGPYLADQLLIPLALANGGRFRTVEPTLHTRTNAAVFEMFLPAKVETTKLDDKTWSVSMGR